MSQALQDVIAERRRQIEAEGLSAAADDGYTAGQLARAAVSYAQTAAAFNAPAPLAEALRHDAQLHFPWRAEWLKSTSARRDAVKAAALLLAEIERIDRAAALQALSSPAPGLGAATGAEMPQGASHDR